MSKARAVEIWAKLERKLIERCGLPDGAMLDRERPGLVRMVGTALFGRAAAAKSVSPPLQTRTEAIEQVSALAGLDIGGGILPPPPDLKIDRRPQSWWRTDSTPDPVLTAMLERSCSRRMGYDGDDEVTYAGPR
jgi:hypothetical protein